MARLNQVVLFCAVIAGSWFAMQTFHEAGHVLGAWITGGQVQRVILHPLTFSRTDVHPNVHPLLVAWMGPMVGVLLPAGVWDRRCSESVVGFCAAILRGLLPAGPRAVSHGWFISAHR